MKKIKSILFSIMLLLLSVSASYGTTATITKGLIGEQDLSKYDGVSSTFTRASSTGGTLTLTKVGYEVDALMSYGGGVNFTRATIASALTAIGGTNRAILVLRPGTWVIAPGDSDLTITSNITLKIPDGASLSIGTGRLVTINGPFEAGNYRVFTGAGTVAFGAGSIIDRTKWATWLGVAAIHNTFTGAEAGAANLAAANEQTGYGYHALYANTVGNFNAAFGGGALESNTTGSFSLAAGTFAASANTTGMGNLALGYQSLLANTTGYGNVSIGSQTGLNLNITANDGTGFNTFVGANSGQGIITGVNNTIIGAHVTGLGATLSNTIIIADGSGVKRIYVSSAGYTGLGTATPRAGLDVLGDLLLGSNVTNTGGAFGRFNKEATATLSGSSTVITLSIPSGARLLGVQLRVDTLVTSADGATSWAAAYSGGSTTALATGQAFTKNTKVNKMHVDEIASNTTNITITPNSNTFSGGVIRAIAYYDSNVALDDKP
jgi:hypothetical protein